MGDRDEDRAEGWGFSWAVVPGPLIREVEVIWLGEWVLPLPGVWVRSRAVNFPFVHCTIGFH